MRTQLTGIFYDNPIKIFRYDRNLRQLLLTIYTPENIAFFQDYNIPLSNKHQRLKDLISPFITEPGESLFIKGHILATLFSRHSYPKNEIVTITPDCPLKDGEKKANIEFMLEYFIASQFNISGITNKGFYKPNSLEAYERAFHTRQKSPDLHFNINDIIYGLDIKFSTYYDRVNLSPLLIYKEIIVQPFDEDMHYLTYFRDTLNYLKKNKERYADIPELRSHLDTMITNLTAVNDIPLLTKLKNFQEEEVELIKTFQKLGIKNSYFKPIFFYSQEIKPETNDNKITPHYLEAESLNSQGKTNVYFAKTAQSMGLMDLIKSSKKTIIEPTFLKDVLSGVIDVTKIM